MAKTRNLGNLSDFLTATGTNVTTTTPAQFDNSTGLATTAFVQRALGNLSSYLNYTATQTIPASAIGSMIGMSTATGGQVLTLPLASTVVIGATVTIQSFSSVNFTVQRQGSDNLTANGGNITSLNVKPGDTFIAVCSNSGGWAISGSATLGISSSGAFTNSLGVSGYQKLPSGLIIQWGVTSILAGTTTYALPLAFPSGFYAVSGTFGTPASGNLYMNVYSLSAFQAQNTYTGTQNANWVAFGL